MPVVYLVVPCYNEEDMLPQTNHVLLERLERLMESGHADEKSRILYVDDGSRDATWSMISRFHKESVHVDGLKLSRNVGHQNALMAGLMTARQYADCAISLDADLQDDVEILDRFMERYREGCEVVYGVRRRRETDTFFKRFTAQSFYRVMNQLGVEVVYNHADYRLLGRRALDALSEYKEAHLFLRGIVPLLGFQSGIVEYDRRARTAGESKYPFKKMVSFALDGVTSFSVKPLKIISNLGLLISALSVGGLLYALLSFFMGRAVPGWTAIVASIWLLGGIQLLCIGVVGGYIGKLYGEVKSRPRYTVETLLHKEE